jgi:hypothetical protein
MLYIAQKVRECKEVARPLYTRMMMKLGEGSLNRVVVCISRTKSGFKACVHGGWRFGGVVFALDERKRVKPQPESLEKRT